jgi:hypothetical protein
MSSQQQDDDLEIYFSGEISNGKIIGLTATDNQGGEYKVTMHLEKVNVQDGEDAVCWNCGLREGEDSDVMLCHQVPC